MLVATCELLRCPACKSGRLDPEGVSGDFIEEGSLECAQCSKNYYIRKGIPVFLDERLSTSSEGTNFATLDKISQQKIKQREWHDTAHMENDFKNTKYEPAKYPYRSRALFAYLLHYQLKEVEELLADGRYQRIANLCSGHGFELEYLSQFGKNILALDISWNSLRRACENGRALGMNIEAICCDAENLPLKDNTFDFVLAHHSFHHLPQPLLGLEEMARISSYRMAFFEPAKGMMRTVVKKLGLKPETEESGNAVYEFGREEIEKFCAQRNLILRHFHKCLITSTASEPAWFRKVDTSRITPIVRGVISAANQGFGNLIGTKCSVVLEKADQAARNSLPIQLT
jgi:ubiquinone/menaquinone biosynthesis C-methylase UbiE/uncharacterized protein YbaR (Trm112 family)